MVSSFGMKDRDMAAVFQGSCCIQCGQLRDDRGLGVGANVTGARAFLRHEMSCFGCSHSLMRFEALLWRQAIFRSIMQLQGVGAGCRGKYCHKSKFCMGENVSSEHALLFLCF